MRSDRVSLDIPDRAFSASSWRLTAGSRRSSTPWRGSCRCLSGSIVLNGVEVTAQALIGVSFFQKDTLLPWKNVVENVALGPKFLGVSRIGAPRPRAGVAAPSSACKTSRAPALANHQAACARRVGIRLRARQGPRHPPHGRGALCGAPDSLTREQMQELLVDVWDRTSSEDLLHHPFHRRGLIPRARNLSSCRPGPGRTGRALRTPISSSRFSLRRRDARVSGRTRPPSGGRFATRSARSCMRPCFFW